jgi:hypothetical protein
MKRKKKPEFLDEQQYSENMGVKEKNLDHYVPSAKNN